MMSRQWFSCIHTLVVIENTSTYILYTSKVYPSWVVSSFLGRNSKKEMEICLAYAYFDHKNRLEAGGHTIQLSKPCHPYGSWMDKIIWRWCDLYEIYGQQEVWQPSRLLQVDNEQSRKIGVDGCRQRQTERWTMNGARSASESSRE